MSIILNLTLGKKITDKEIEIELYEICDREHSSCNSDCPVYKINGNKVPDTVNDCDCFKSGSKMLEFIRKHAN